VILAGVVLGRIAFGMQLQSVASLGPDLVAAFHLDYAALGTLIGLYMLPGAFVAIPGGMLGRRFGDKAVLGAGFALMTLGGLACGFAPGPASLAVARVVSGCGGVILAVMMGKVTADAFAAGGFVLAMGLVVGGFPIGVGLNQLLTPVLTRAFGWHGDFLMGAAVAGAAFVCFLAGGPPGRRHVLRGAPLLPSRHECLLVFLAGAVWTAYNAGYFGFLSYIPSFLAARGQSVALTGLVMAIGTWGNIPLILIGSALAVRFGNMRVFTVGMLALIVGLMGIATTAYPVSWAILFGTVGAMQASVIVAAGTLSARPEYRTIGMGIFYTTYYVGGTVLPGLFGHAADRAGSPSGALLAAAAVAVLALPLFWLHQHLARPRRAVTA
jgi:predicted MFS family arabinose efflux permease